MHELEMKSAMKKIALLLLLAAIPVAADAQMQPKPECGGSPGPLHRALPLTHLLFFFFFFYLVCFVQLRLATPPARARFCARTFAASATSSIISTKASSDMSPGPSGIGTSPGIPFFASLDDSLKHMGIDYISTSSTLTVLGKTAPLANSGRARLHILTSGQGFLTSVFLRTILIARAKLQRSSRAWVVHYSFKPSTPC